jgi:hypothetical protein
MTPCIVPVLPLGIVALSPPNFSKPLIRLYPPSIETSKFLSSLAAPGVLSKSIELADLIKPPAHATV